MNINKIFPSKYLKADDLDGREYALTIAKFALEDVGQPPQTEEKPVIYFREAKKGLILNKTNGMTIAALYTPETDNWIGKRITLYSTKVRAFGAIHDAVRIRPDVPPPPKGDNGDGDGEPSGPLDQGIDDLEDVVDDVDVDAMGPPLSYEDDPFRAETLTSGARAPLAGPTPAGDGPATPEHISTLQQLAKDLKGNGWQGYCGQLVKSVNDKREGGPRAERLADLSAAEAETLIAILRKRRVDGAIAVQSNGDQKAPRVAA